MAEEVIPLTATSRLVVEPDTDAEPPRGGDWGALCGFVDIEELGDSRRVPPAAVHEAPAPVARIFRHLRFRKGVPAHTDVIYRQREQAIEQTIRAARILTGLEFVWDDTYGGFWFRAYDGDESGDRTDQLEAIAAERAVYEQWASGDVSVVRLERLETYVHVTDSGSDVIPDDVDWGWTREFWEEVDGGALAGCYLDDEYTAQAVALEHFPLTADERAAAEGKLPAGDLES